MCSLRRTCCRGRQTLFPVRRAPVRWNHEVHIESSFVVAHERACHESALDFPRSRPHRIWNYCYLCRSDAPVHCRMRSPMLDCRTVRGCCAYHSFGRDLVSTWAPPSTASTFSGHSERGLFGSYVADQYLHSATSCRCCEGVSRLRRRITGAVSAAARNISCQSQPATISTANSTPSSRQLRLSLRRSDLYIYFSTARRDDRCLGLQ